MPILVRVVHKDVFLLWCLAYLRLVTLRAATEAVIPNLETVRTLWAVAAQVRAATGLAPVHLNATLLLE